QRDELAPSFVEHGASPPLPALGAGNDHQPANGPQPCRQEKKKEKSDTKDFFLSNKDCEENNHRSRTRLHPWITRVRSPSSCRRWWALLGSSRAADGLNACPSRYLHIVADVADDAAATWTVIELLKKPRSAMVRRPLEHRRHRPDHGWYPT